MRKLVFLFLLLPCMTFAQSKLHLSLFGGFSNYQGDLQGKRFSLDQSNGVFGAGLKYDLNARWSVRTSFNIGSIGADDKKNIPSLQPRNLNFRSKISEANLLLEYNLLDPTGRRFAPYLFGGLAVFHFNPYTFDTLGNKIYLRPLGTEGQGLAQYPERKMYKLTQLSLPFGAGIRLRVNDQVQIGYEIGLRKTFTDYLDDVSTTYADPFLLAQFRGLKSVEMAYRGGELKNGDPNYPPVGSIRGGSRFKDWYYFQGITLTIGLNTGNGILAGKSGKKGSVDCPKL